jgi:hypothetical protein
MHFVLSTRSFLAVAAAAALLLTNCGSASSNAPPPAAHAPDATLAAPLAASAAAPSADPVATAGSSPGAPGASPTAASPAGPFACTEVIGLTITAEWYGAGFEQLVDDSRFQARTRPHTFVDQWADPAHHAWSAPVTSPCAAASESPDRVVLFAANWKLTSEEEWARVLTAFVATAKQRYPRLRDLSLYTVLRGPSNQTCGDPKSVVAPMVDAAITRVAATEPTLVHAGPRLEARDCAEFEKGGPHFSQEGRKVVAQRLAAALR